MAPKTFPSVSSKNISAPTPTMIDFCMMTLPPAATTALAVSSIDGTAMVHSKPIIRWPATSSRRRARVGPVEVRGVGRDARAHRQRELAGAAAPRGVAAGRNRAHRGDARAGVGTDALSCAGAGEGTAARLLHRQHPVAAARAD